MSDAVDMPRRSRSTRTVDLLDERLGLKALQYPVPEHANNLGWSLGGVTAAMLFVLIGTGIFLTQFYNPTPEVANQSVRDVVTNVWGGRFVRGVHYWSPRQCTCSPRCTCSGFSSPGRTNGRGRPTG